MACVVWAVGSLSGTGGGVQYVYTCNYFLPDLLGWPIGGDKFFTGSLARWYGS